jgi:hypothetical protein
MDASLDANVEFGLEVTQNELEICLSNGHATRSKVQQRSERQTMNCI